MYPHAQFIFQEFLQTTNWSIENHYSSLTLPSRNLLDFSIPPGLNLSLSHRPTSLFASSLALSALVPSHPITYPPTPAPVLGPPLSSLLAGQLTYIFSSAELGLKGTKRKAKDGEKVVLKEVLQGFKVGGLPIAPDFRDGAQPTWQGGERVDKQDYLLYGRLYAPSPRLDALWVHRLSVSTQALLSLVSVPSQLSVSPLSWQSADENSTSAKIESASSGTAARLSELEIKIQQDVGRWSTEYSYAVGDQMWGMRGLWNFGKSGNGEAVEVEEKSEGPSTRNAELEKRERVVDEEEEMSTGLKGRWSAGGEVYFSAQERSAGVSTGVRFCTLPESFSLNAGAIPTQPPTTITATLNPIMGQLSTAYSVAISPDSALASRFDFNMFSYDADLTFGGEWFQRNKKRVIREEVNPKIQDFDAFGRGGLDTGVTVVEKEEEGEVNGVLKFRASTNTDLALLWEGRLGDFLVSIGVVADLRLATRTGGRRSPIRSVGIGIQYWG